jgi:asparagine synthase (glutamine-hydrolysing)
MCGFLGYAGADPIRDERFRRALDLLRHRGPDDDGELRIEGPGGTEVRLGHRRLAILDLSPRGRQPMVSARTGAAVVYNGEIYNFREIRAELEQLGRRFQSGCDTEVLLAAYDEWGQACLDRLVGMFAFAVHDPRTHRIFLARDRLGIKPLYYLHDGIRFAFASELTAITALGTAPLRIVPGAAAEYLAFGCLPGELTPLEHHRKILPGHAAEYDLETRRLRVWRYWRALDFYSAAEWDAPEEVLLDQLEGLLLEAVSRRLISDVPLGAFLSGGIDSSLIVALMCRAAPERVRSFTIGFTVPSWDEAPHAKAVAAHLGTEHHELYVSPKGLEDALVRAAALYDEPFADSSCIPTAILSQMAREHVTVALSGDGGDELFFGYGRHRRAGQYMRFRRLPGPVRAAVTGAMSLVPSARLRRHARLLRSGDVGEFYAQLTGTRLPGLTPGGTGDAAARAGACGPLGDAAGRAGAQGLLGDVAAREVCAAVGEDAWTKIVTATDLIAFLPDDLLTKVDRASMAVGLEVRVPLLDHRVVEFAARVPQHFKFQGGRSKHLLRRVLARHVPERLWDRPKTGFGIPLAPWFRRELRPWVEDELTARWDWTLGVIDEGEARRLIAAHMAGRGDYARWIWAFITWKSWARRVGLVA